MDVRVVVGLQEAFLAAMGKSGDHRRSEQGCCMGKDPRAAEDPSHVSHVSGTYVGSLASFLAGERFSRWLLRRALAVLIWMMSALLVYVADSCAAVGLFPGCTPCHPHSTKPRRWD